MGDWSLRLAYKRKRRAEAKKTCPPTPTSCVPAANLLQSQASLQIYIRPPSTQTRWPDLLPLCLARETSLRHHPKRSRLLASSSLPALLEPPWSPHWLYFGLQQIQKGFRNRLAGLQ
ncbi:hypothetical protein PICMEDRAFT_177635 [Pichia membranifaciens NRRL Y-2026]|uniref:Uncharacterized protein n=1 Tax=Pichia membranifaciens NRRL Y-2026 TaxID=763406 RepID=A0A1E3NFC4_9ASCO|nr:hypothetical protein PICMEDRAFT_177635 [Pichia membranifaciens NRRL Y-2026]ODQ44830.1 hypothetical protein PICMEDRAFT_177635 [Pichia membranifaciens NRRL Y-2026]